MKAWSRYWGFWSPIWEDPDTGRLNYLPACNLGLAH
jgi:hypothetical protein